MFSKEQKRVLIGCFIAYTAAYMGRLNLSEALPSIGSALSLNDALLGTLQTVFAVTYAAGQLIVGMAADRCKARTFIMIGLAGTALANMLFGFVNAYLLMVVLWMLNGVAQSMLWTPIVKTVAEWFQGKARARAAFIMSAATILGHLLGWLIAGAMASAFSWRLSFIVPALVLFAVLLICGWLIKDRPKAEPNQARTVAAQAMPLRDILFSTGLWALLITCVINGFVRDGIVTWGPSMIARAFGEGTSDIVLISMLIPLLNTLGWGACRLYFGKSNASVRKSVCVFMLAGSVATFGLWCLTRSQPLLLATMLGLSCAIMYGNTPLLTAMLPMEYESANRIALVAGLVDCFIYLGSGLAGVANGMISDAYGWQAVLPIWAATCVVGALCAYISSKYTWRAQE